MAAYMNGSKKPSVEREKLIREEIRNLVKKVGITTLFVTHDQEEALSIGDKIIIQGQTTGSITHTIDSMQIEGKSVEKVDKNSNVAISMPTKVRKNDFVYKLVERNSND